mmetsp:Transcript_5663/g.13303  ORF Transcript_5663/g.13303 Transcript_5663/m.13303 type:complete len:396 (+) Transcript_5663:1590-2777(+)
MGAISRKSSFQATVCFLLAQLVDLCGNKTGVQVDIVEVLYVGGKRFAFQLVSDPVEVGHVPQALLSFHESLVLGKSLRLRFELAEPGVDGPGLVSHDVLGFHGVLECRLGVLRVAPHVRHEGPLCDLDAATTKPSSQGLIDVLAAPGHHVRVVALGLLPPPSAQSQKTSTHQRHLPAWISKPSEVGIPGHVASLAWGCVVVLLPRIRVQRGDRRNDDCSVVPSSLHLFQKCLLPAFPGFYVAVKEYDDVPKGCITPGLLGANESFGRFVPHESNLGILEEVFWKLLLQRRCTTIVDDDDFFQAVGFCVLKHRPHCFHSILPFEGAWKHHAHRLQVHRCELCDLQLGKTGLRRSRIHDLRWGSEVVVGILLSMFHCRTWRGSYSGLQRVLLEEDRS